MGHAVGVHILHVILSERLAESCHRGKICDLTGVVFTKIFVGETFSPSSMGDRIGCCGGGGGGSCSRGGGSGCGRIIRR